jgi:uncharacterized membrane protein (DUF106 family)
MNPFFSQWLSAILRPEVLVFAIPIVAILGGVAFQITRAILIHRERMTKIEHGIDPDANGGKKF